MLKRPLIIWQKKTGSQAIRPTIGRKLKKSSESDNFLFLTFYDQTGLIQRINPVGSYQGYLPVPLRENPQTAGKPARRPVAS